jgi:hypothetical protein
MSLLGRLGGTVLFCILILKWSHKGKIYFVWHFSAILLKIPRIGEQKCNFSRLYDEAKADLWYCSI